MKLAFIAYSLKGTKSAEKLSRAFKEDEISFFTVKRLSNEIFLKIPQKSRSFFKKAFKDFDALIFVCACGIAVRSIAPFVRDKKTDPAVLCVDELARFVIPLLSGHIGGANALAERIAAFSGAVPCVTTATDINGRFSVDLFAKERGYIIDDFTLAKKVSAAALERDVPFYSDLFVKNEYPQGIYKGDKGELGICLSAKIKTPFKQTLRLVPKTLVLGVGCRRGTDEEKIENAVNALFSEYSLDTRALCAVCSIDLKKNEKGLLSFCEKNNIKPLFYTAEELSKVKGDFSGSDFVKSVTGTDNVCERAAALYSKREPFIKKKAFGGVTLAVAEIQGEVLF